MEWNLLQLLFLLPLFCAGSSDDHECTPKTPNIGDTLELDCPCGEIDFKLDWFYKFDVNAEVALVSRGGLNERNYTFVVQNASLGGVYHCACTPAEPCPEGECTECFNVSVKPTISSFTIQPPVARVGMPIMLMCNATGHPDPVLQDFHLTKVDLPVILPALQKTGSGVTVTINATLNHSGTFKCLVNLEGIGHAMADTSATVYEPPVIVNVVNFTVNDYMQSIAAIKCLVKNDSTAAKVRWTRNGRSLEEGPQFLFSSYLEAVNMVLYVLFVNNLSRQYIGEYQCIAGSQFNDTDDIRSVWIVEDGTIPVIPPPSPPSADSRGTHPGVIAGGVVAVVLALAVIVVIACGAPRLYQRYYRDQFEPPAIVNVANFTSNETGASRTGNRATTSPPSDPDSEHRDTSSYTESTATSFSVGNEGDLMSLSEQDSQCRSSSVNSLNPELLRRRTLSSSDMTTSVTLQ